MNDTDARFIYERDLEDYRDRYLEPLPDADAEATREASYCIIMRDLRAIEMALEGLPDSSTRRDALQRLHESLRAALEWFL